MNVVRNENGISLIEVIVGFAILSIILFSFMGLLLQSKKTNASSEEIQDVTFLAQEEMEAIYMLSRDSKSFFENPSSITLNDSHTYTLNSQEGPYELNVCLNVSPAMQKIEKKLLYKSSFNGYAVQLDFSFTCKPNQNILGKVLITIQDAYTGKEEIKIENAFMWK